MRILPTAHPPTAFCTRARSITPPPHPSRAFCSRALSLTPPPHKQVAPSRRERGGRNKAPADTSRAEPRPSPAKSPAKSPSTPSAPAAAGEAARLQQIVAVDLSAADLGDISAPPRRHLGGILAVSPQESGAAQRRHLPRPPSQPNRGRAGRAETPANRATWTPPPHRRAATWTPPQQQRATWRRRRTSAGCCAAAKA